MTETNNGGPDDERGPALNSRRYRVEKIGDPEGKHADCRYFVLDPQHDPIARLALAVYASRVGDDGNERLEMDLIAWLDAIGAEECPHDWLDRPESDTRECLICGVER